jgi:LPXTG-motif cell wall-anchored protein
MLCRGLDANIEGWGTCVRANSGPGSNPEELAKTGASSSVNATSLLMATGLLAAGIFAMIASRRRRAHN